jgi:hypothetical protein
MIAEEKNLLESYVFEAWEEKFCAGDEAFEEDFKTFSYIKKIFSRYNNGSVLPTRLLINHIITASNVFGPRLTSTILFSKINKESWGSLKAVLSFLNYYTETPSTKEVNLDSNILALLEKEIGR